MTKRIKKLTVLIATALIFAFMGVVTLFTHKTATAQTEGLNENNFKVCAAVRLKKPNEQTDNGIRFVVLVEKGVYQTLDENFVSGTLLIPEELSGGKDLTVDITGEEPVAEGAQVSHTPTKSVDGSVNAWQEYTDENGDEWMMAAVYLWGIPEAAYDADVLARGYIVADGEVYYTKSVVRSIAYVANAALNDPDESWDTTEAATLEGYVPTYDTINVEDEEGGILTSYSDTRYGETVSYTLPEEEGKQFKVFYDNEELTANEQGAYEVAIKSSQAILVKEYIEVDTAAEFKAMDLVNNNYVLTKDIALADITTSIVPTNISRSEDGASAYKPQALIAKVEKHLDGNGYTLSYNFRGGGDANRSLIGIFNGTISNLKVDATVRMVYGHGAFVSQGWSNSVVENCYIKVTTATDDNNSVQDGQGVFNRFGGKMSNTIIELNVLATNGNAAMHAIAFGPSYLTTSTFSYATFKDVVVITDAGRQIYDGNNAGTNAPAGASVYTDKAAMLAAYDFSAWDTAVWTVEKDGDTVTDLVFGRPAPATTYIEVSTAAQFKAMDLVNNDYILTADINLGDITSQLVATNISASPDGGSGYKPSALIAKVEKHLNGNGHTLTYSFTGNGETKYALIGILNGKISNLTVDATTRAVTNNAVLATHAWGDSIVENCYIKVTTATNDNNSDQQGVFIRFGGKMINTVIELNVLTESNTRFHAIAYGPAFITTGTFNNPTFENVVVIAKSTQAIYNNGATSATGVSVYTSKEGMYAGYDFSKWNTSVWAISKDASGNVTGVGLKNPQ